jgi:hypothetical protein
MMPAQDVGDYSATDEQVAHAFMKVRHMVLPPESLFAPHVLAKVMLFRFKQLFAGLGGK